MNTTESIKQKFREYGNEEPKYYVDEYISPKNEKVLLKRRIFKIHASFENIAVCKRVLSDLQDVGTVNWKFYRTTSKYIDKGSADMCGIQFYTSIKL